MKLAFLSLDKLSVSKFNMRHARKAPDVSDILPTVRARGVLQPLIVRPCPDSGGAEDTGHHEIVAGARRFHAACIVERERTAELTGERTGRPSAEPTAEPTGKPSAEPGEEPGHEVAQLPCAILEEGDDAAAIEASLIENSARLDPDEVARWECFIRLVREGRKPEDIAATFGLPDLAVKRILALGNLLPRIRDLYRRGEIDAATVRHLTLASKSQQKAWLGLMDDPEAYAPKGYQLKAWLFGGQSVPASNALFDVPASGLVTIADLFGEDSYFADSAAFWAAQNAAIEARCTSYIEQGWADALVVGPETHFHAWEYEKTPKRKGGRVYLDVRANGEVIAHEGYLAAKEARRLAKAGTGEDSDGASGRAARGELTSTMQTYIHLHRHAAVRAELLDHPGTALRLMLAHAIVGSSLWRVSSEPQATRNDAVKESLENSPAEAVFDKARVAALTLVNFSPEEPNVTGENGSGDSLCALFVRLLRLSDDDVSRIVAVVMGETLASGSPAVESVAGEIGVAMHQWWRADDAFFEPLRDREVLLALLAEVGGAEIAAANAGEKSKVVKGIIRDHLDGTNGRERRDGWVPRWMAFPPSAYTARGGVETVDAHRRSQIVAEEADESEGGDGGESGKLERAADDAATGEDVADLSACGRNFGGDHPTCAPNEDGKDDREAA